MTWPTPTNMIWNYRCNESKSWHGMVWHGGSRTMLVRIEPFAESDTHFPDKQTQQKILAKFWRRLGAA